MKITSVEVQAYRVPITWRADPVVAAVARVRTDDGLEGLGPAIPFSALHVRSLLVAIEELRELLIGEDPRQPERVHRKLMPGGAGYGGTDNIAVAALDVAVWDLAAKSAGLPLYRALGGYRNRIPVYASLRLGRDLSLAALTETAAALVAQGFTAMKMNLGGDAGIAADVARVQAVRETIGPDVRLLADVNFRWTSAQAIRAARELEQFDLYWLEDPVPTHNLEGLAEVRRGSGIPLAAGEALFGLAALRSLFEARAVDFPMPDLLRVGGVTPFLKAAHLAEAFGLPLASHLSPEIAAQVVAAVPNGHIVEYNGWAWELFQGCPTLENGELVMSERPGHGLSLDADVARQRAVESRMQINLDLALLQMYPPAQLIRVVQLCERLGYRTFRYGNEKYFRDPWIGLAVAAEHTRSLRLSTFVQDPFTLHPALTAVAIATLDELSGGRAELVLGAGGGGGGALGYQRIKPARAIRETIEVVRGLLRGERVHYDGEVVRFGGGRLSFPARPALPILIASRGNLVLQMAGRHADGVMIATYATPPGVAHALAQVDKGLTRSGRTRGDIALNSRVDAWVHRDPRVAREALRPMIAGFLTTSYPDTNFVRVVGQEVSPELEAVLARKDRDHAWANAHLVSDELLAQLCWAGTAEQVAAQIAAVVRLGITDVTVTLHPPKEATAADVEEVIRSFAQDVKPLAEQLSG